MICPTRKYRAIRIVALGTAMANNVATTAQGAETLHWDQFMALGGALIGKQL